MNPPLQKTDDDSALITDGVGMELSVKHGLKEVEEIPVVFQNGSYGRNKPAFQAQVDYLRRLKRQSEFKLGPLSRPLQFALVGSTGVVVDLAAFTALILILPLSAARALAIWAAMSWNFWVNRHLTFSDRRAHSALRQYILFCLSCTIGAVVNWSVSIELCSAVPFFARWKLLAAFCGIVGGTVFNYLFSAHVAFKKHRSGPVASARGAFRQTSGDPQ